MYLSIVSNRILLLGLPEFKNGLKADVEVIWSKSPKYGQTMANLDLKVCNNNNTNTLGLKIDEKKNKMLTIP